MMAVTMKMFTLGLLAISLVVGCSPRKVSLDEEISELPVAWSGFKTIGASSNNWALLDRVSAVEDDNHGLQIPNSSHREAAGGDLCPQGREVVAPSRPVPHILTFLQIPP